jgi:predicted nucleic acid-binding Zn ribbon protein
VGIVFKGSGFYATDHRSPSGQPRSITPKGDSPQTESNPESKSDSKSDSKSESEAKKETPTITAGEKP